MKKVWKQGNMNVTLFCVLPPRHWFITQLAMRCIIPSNRLLIDRGWYRSWRNSVSCERKVWVDRTKWINMVFRNNYCAIYISRLHWLWPVDQVKIVVSYPDFWLRMLFSRWYCCRRSNYLLKFFCMTLKMDKNTW